MYNADKVYSFHLTETEIKQYPYFNYEEQDKSLAYANIYMLDYDLLKEEEYYAKFEKEYLGNGYSFKESFTKTYFDYYELEERLNDFHIIPQQYFHQIIAMSDIEINQGFKIASIDFIKSNIKNQGYGTIILNKTEDFLKECGFKTITLQLLKNNEKLINFYKKAGFKSLKTIKDKHTNCLFMYKDI